MKSHILVVTCLSLAAIGSSWRVAAQAKVQPVFLAKRAGHTRCVVCHTINNAPLHLVPLSSGSTTWTEEQSRQNFQLVQKVVVPGWEGARCSPTRSPSRPAVIPITAGASNSARRTIRNGRR
jgi:hypothetical protein